MKAKNFRQDFTSRIKVRTQREVLPDNETLTQERVMNFESFERDWRFCANSTKTLNSHIFLNSEDDENSVFSD